MNEEIVKWNGNSPWKNIGYSLDGANGVESILDKAQINYPIGKVPLFGTVDLLNGKVHQIQSKEYSVVRLDNGVELTTIPADGKLFQNTHGAEFFEELISKTNTSQFVAGEISDGQYIFFLSKITEFSPVEDDKYTAYFHFTLPHIWGKNSDIRLLLVRGDGISTINLPLNDLSDVQVKLNDSSFDFSDLMSCAEKKITTFTRNAKILSEEKIEDLEEFLLANFPRVGQGKNLLSDLPRTAKLINQAITEQPDFHVGEGSWWSVFNAITYTMDHILGRTTETRLKSSWYQTNRTKKLSVFNKLLDRAST